MATEDRVEAGQAVYTPLTLLMYDSVVLGISNRFLWRCPTSKLRALYQRNASSRHLDIGVGTGYFLDKNNWKSATPEITLVDLNPHSLAAASNRIARFTPQQVTANVFEPLPIENKFASIGLCYVLHCLPGTMSEKAPVVFANVKQNLAADGKLFGATILQGDVPRSGPAQALMNFYNSKGIFSNREDTLQALEQALNDHFDVIHIKQFGAVATFEAQNK